MALANPAVGLPADSVSDRRSIRANEGNSLLYWNNIYCHREDQHHPDTDSVT